MTFVETLEPRALWRHFDRILEIPRGSKQEDRIREYVIQVAEQHGLDTASMPRATSSCGSRPPRRPR
jgi:di/tripeptidase